MYLHGNNAQHKTSSVRNYSEWFNTLFLSFNGTSSQPTIQRPNRVLN